MKSESLNDSFIEFATVKTSELYSSGCIRSFKKHNGFLNKIKKFQHGHDLKFHQIDYQYLVRFKAFLDSLPNDRRPERRIHPNTVNQVLAVFRTNINKAIREGKMSNNPFGSFKMKNVRTIKEKLSSDEIERIRNLDLPHGSALWHCRNFFMFSFFCAGIRTGDLMQLRWRNVADGRLRYQMGKNHKQRDLLLVRQALDILKSYKTSGSKSSDYIFPLLSMSKKYATFVTEMDYDSMNVETKNELFKDISTKNIMLNRLLGRIAELAGIEKHLTMHVSRHSFAKIAKDKGTDNSAIQQMLAHSSLKITEIYMGNFDTGRTDTALANIFCNETPRIETCIRSLCDMLRSTNDEDFVKMICSEVSKRIVRKEV